MTRRTPLPATGRAPHALALLALLALLVAGCGPDAASDFDPYLVRSLESAPLAARCTAVVEGSGVIDVEGDYLPHVVACENGAADLEALKAQAVAARSYLYYRLATGDGTIDDGQGDQVYSCGREPLPQHYQAVAETAGEVLMYQGTLVSAFYVAGAVPSDRVSCIAAPGDDDYSNTERYVTVNWEASGDGLVQTSLGWVHPDNHANRGCKSQNGAHCLAEAGWSYEDILLFYYGADIDHVLAEGDCVESLSSPHGCGVLVEAGAVETIFDDGDLCFMKGCRTRPAWSERDVGHSGGSLVTGGWVSDEDDCFARWRLSFEATGRYAIEAHIPDVGPRVSEVVYRVAHGDAIDEVPVSIGSTMGWVSLGEHTFARGSFQYVELGDRAPENGDLAAGPYVVFDALRVRPVSPPGGAPDAGADVEEPIAAEDAGPDAGAPDVDAGVGSDGGGSDKAPVDLDLPKSVVSCASGGDPATGSFVALLALGLVGLSRRGCRGRRERRGRGAQRPSKVS